MSMTCGILNGVSSFHDRLAEFEERKSATEWFHLFLTTPNSMVYKNLGDVVFFPEGFPSFSKRYFLCHVAYPAHSFFTKYNVITEFFLSLSGLELAR